MVSAEEKRIIVICVDDEVLRGDLCRIYEKEADFVLQNKSDEAIMNFIKIGTVDAIIIDRMFRGLDKTDLIRKIRILGNTVPIIVLSPLFYEADMISCLRAGADDYIVKPLDFSYLNIVFYNLRKRARERFTQLRIGSITMDLIDKLVLRKDKIYRVGRLHFVALETFMTFPDQPIGRRTLKARLWPGQAPKQAHAPDLVAYQLNDMFGENVIHKQLSGSFMLKSEDA